MVHESGLRARRGWRTSGLIPSRWCCGWWCFLFTWTNKVIYLHGYRVPFLLDSCYYLALDRAVVALCEWTFDRNDCRNLYLRQLWDQPHEGKPLQTSSQYQQSVDIEASILVLEINFHEDDCIRLWCCETFRDKVLLTDLRTRGWCQGWSNVWKPSFKEKFFNSSPL